MLTRITGALFLAFMTGSCAALGGGEPAASTVSYIRGYSTECSGSLHIIDPATRSPSTRIEKPAGIQRMQVVFEGRPYWPQDLNPNYLCVDISHHTVEFETRPGRFYSFFMSEASHSDHELTVWESADRGVAERTQVAASTSQTAIRRACYLDGFIAGCIPGGI